MIIPFPAVYQVPLQEAIRVTGATCSAVGLYQRLGRLRKQNARLEEDSARGFDLQRQQVLFCTKEVETEQASVHMQEADETDCLKISSGLNDLPTWMDRDSGRKSLVRETRRSITQAHLFRLKAQVSTKNYDAHYKDAHKAATMEMKNSEGKRGTGLLAVVSRINEEMLSSPNDKKLTKSSVHRAVSPGGNLVCLQ